jgi:hypothetical protein
MSDFCIKADWQVPLVLGFMPLWLFRAKSAGFAKPARVVPEALDRLAEGYRSCFLSRA